MEMIADELCKIGELPNVELYYGGWAPGEENNKIASFMSCAGASNIFDVIPALDVNCYGQMYNHIDVCLAPLYKDEFTQSKSELKALEAGFMMCALVASPIKSLLRMYVMKIIVYCVMEVRDGMKQ